MNIIALIAVIALIAFMFINVFSTLNKKMNKSDARVTLNNRQAGRTSSILATVLRVIGVLDILGALILASGFEESGAPIICGIIVMGMTGAVFCFAIAKCVEAAEKILNS